MPRSALTLDPRAGHVTAGGSLSPYKNFLHVLSDMCPDSSTFSLNRVCLPGGLPGHVTLVAD